MKFDDTNLLDALDAASGETLDALPFGVVSMNDKHEVLHYNTYEAELAELSPESVTGKNFFAQVAPCTNNFMVSHKYAEDRDLDETLPYVFTYALKPTNVTLRLLKKKGAEKQYLLVQKD